MNKEPLPIGNRIMHESGTRRLLCVKCGFLLEPFFLFCPRCGTRQAEGDAWYYQPIWIFILAFAALGPFALPLVWKSPKMTSPGKIVMTGAIVIYTFLSLYYGYVLFVMILKRLNDFDRVLTVDKISIGNIFQLEREISWIQNG